MSQTTHRDEAILTRYHTGQVSMAELAEEHGLSRQRVSQIVRGQDKKAAARVQRRRDKTSKAQREAEKLAYVHPCAVCGRPVYLVKRRTCSFPALEELGERCAVLWRKKVRHKDPQAREDQWDQQARSVVRSPNKYPEWRVRTARKRLGLTDAQGP